ncbi:hypothetical protein PAUR_a0955 [Pseudoalteromonas aurantia 208]|uniref:Orphan protein n=1 Tax=Pseudoalteromonas aurantia 208 TaxID=1314867 RepID=A0ABR9E9B1_9GAMM|nr:hypothetical protein [Pseudoalteromonas aurantia 208]
MAEESALIKSLLFITLFLYVVVSRNNSSEEQKINSMSFFCLFFVNF